MAVLTVVAVTRRIDQSYVYCLSFPTLSSVSQIGSNEEGRCLQKDHIISYHIIALTAYIRERRSRGDMDCCHCSCWKYRIRTFEWLNG